MGEGKIAKRGCLIRRTRKAIGFFLATKQYCCYLVCQYSKILGYSRY